MKDIEHELVARMLLISKNCIHIIEWLCNAI